MSSSLKLYDGELPDHRPSKPWPTAPAMIVASAVGLIVVQTRSGSASTICWVTPLQSGFGLSADGGVTWPAPS